MGIMSKIKEKQKRKMAIKKPRKKEWKSSEKGLKSITEPELEIVKTNKNSATVSKNSKIDNDSDIDSDKEAAETRKLVAQQNRKKKKSGGFQSMGLSYPIFKGITKKGYNVPTPIQRKTIPLILDGKDVVAMARTGSGKTAAFLIPMFERLKAHSPNGARAMIMSPTRELALQTLKFTKDLGRFTGLKAAVILGGDRMEDQFAALHENPDIIIATPGRFLHIVVEMDMKLKSVEYVVFDEADRLFEMGFQVQLTEVINRLPDSRQTLLFSATLPKILVDFAKAGLTDPTLIRLDVDTKLSENLKLAFLQCRVVDKMALLIHLLQTVIQEHEQTVVFAATKHHVEYINAFLEKIGINCSYIYSSLDQTHRKISIARFQNRQVKVMIVTDLAARGIDIPMLDNVINFNFPAKAKLFVHRVGRVARAGRCGTAYSLVAMEEVAYLYDLHIFLGQPIKRVPSSKKVNDESGWFGEVPQRVIDSEAESVRILHNDSKELQDLKRVSENAYKQYVKSRSLAAQESVKRMKEVERSGVKLGVHPLFASVKTGDEEQRLDLLDALRAYKSHTTVFEVNASSKTQSFEVMKKKRAWHSKVILANETREACKAIPEDQERVRETQEEANQELVKNVFSTVIESGRNRIVKEVRKGKKRKLEMKDEENYLHYRPADYQSEKGLRVGSTFDQQASGAMLNITGDDDAMMKRHSNQLKWDRKKKKYIQEQVDPKKKKIKTESGAWIYASYKSNAYKDWRSKNKVLDGPGEGNENTTQDKAGRFMVMGSKGKRWHTKGSEEDQTKSGKRRRFKDIKSTEQIFKMRKKKSDVQNFQKKRRDERAKKSVKNKKSKKK